VWLVLHVMIAADFLEKAGAYSRQKRSGARLPSPAACAAEAVSTAGRAPSCSRGMACWRIDPGGIDFLSAPHEFSGILTALPHSQRALNRDPGMFSRIGGNA